MVGHSHQCKYCEREWYCTSCDKSRLIACATCTAGEVPAHLGSRALVVKLISAERERQDARWGKQDHADLYWLAILTEAQGKVAQALVKGRQDDVMSKLVDVAAVAVAWLECVDKRANRLHSKRVIDDSNTSDA